MEAVIVPTKVEQVQTAKNPALKVTYSDNGKEFNKMIFDSGLWNLFAVNLPVKIITEKQGQYWNVVGAESVKDALTKPTESNEKTYEEVEAKATKLLSQPNTKNRSYALSYAKDIAVATIGQGKEMSTNVVIGIAEVFDKYLNGEE